MIGVPYFWTIYFTSCLWLYPCKWFTTLTIKWLCLRPWRCIVYYSTIYFTFVCLLVPVVFTYAWTWTQSWLLCMIYVWITCAVLATFMNLLYPNIVRCAITLISYWRFATGITHHLTIYQASISSSIPIHILNTETSIKARTLSLSILKKRTIKFTSNSQLLLYKIIPILALTLLLRR